MIYLHLMTMETIVMNMIKILVGVVNMILLILILNLNVVYVKEEKHLMHHAQMTNHILISMVKIVIIISKIQMNVESMILVH